MMLFKKRLLLIFTFLFFVSPAFSQQKVFIKFADTASEQQIGKFLNSIRSADSPLTSSFEKSFDTENFGLSRIYTATITGNTTPEKIKENFNSRIAVEYVEYVNTLKIDLAPNDSLYSEQWYLEKIGAEAAWKKTKGDKTVIIGIIDTGIDYLHEDLQANLYINNAEDLNNNGILDEADLDNIDNDGNGYTDDVIGYDFTDREGFPHDPSAGDYLVRDNDPMDEHGHGTYVAGVIGAVQNNFKGISGLAPQCTILTLRAFDPGGYGEEDDVASAILYAVKAGAKVINMSFGDVKYSLVLKDVLEYAAEQGVTFVASAGNSSNSDLHYPSAFDNVISVGASTEADNLASFSNYGSSVDLLAPGQLILTTGLDEPYTVTNGTSFAAPLVSAAAGLILSLKDYSPGEIKQLLKSSSDDILEPGWDIKSSAGRLNVKKALQSIEASSLVRFDSPEPGLVTKEDSVAVRVSVLSPYFEKYDIYYGTGINPDQWTKLGPEHKNQSLDEKIGKLDISSFPDTVYTFRLVMTRSDGRTSEERVNFTISRKAPYSALVNFGPAYYGSYSTIFASVYSEKNSIAEMYYREKGTMEFDFFSLDGFTTNSKFVETSHFGFIPEQKVKQGTEYEIYFKVYDPAGNDTTITEENGEYFLIRTDDSFTLKPFHKLDRKLPAGRIYGETVTPTGLQKNILLNELYNPANLYFYSWSQDTFIQEDSLVTRVPVETGDFNNNGKTDILSTFVRKAFIDEQAESGTYDFSNVFSDTTDDMWPVGAGDYDNDSRTEMLVLKGDSLFKVYELQDNLQPVFEKDLPNLSEWKFYGNYFGQAEAEITDLNNDGIKEIIFVDNDGDIIIYSSGGEDSYAISGVIETQFNGFDFSVSSGDINGNGHTDLAVLLNSSSALDIGSFYILFVYEENNGVLEQIYVRAFINPSDEYNIRFQQENQSVKFDNLDNDDADELIVFAFPYAYVLDNVSEEFPVIFFEEGINSKNIYTGDIDNNGVRELALPYSDRIEFVEFGNSSGFIIPELTDGYSISDSKIKLEWGRIETSTSYYIYKGEKEENLFLFDSAGANSFIDSSVVPGKTYYYSIAYIKDERISPLSEIMGVFSHSPAVFSQAESVSEKSVILTFTGKVYPTILGLKSFRLNNLTYPSSVTLYDEKSYICTFEEALVAGENSITVTNIKDFYGSPIEAEEKTFIVDEGTEITELYITGYSVIDKYTLEVEFNLPLDTASAINMNNYSFTPESSIENIRLVSPNATRIKSSNPVTGTGREVILKINGLTSTSATGFAKLRKNSGSSVSALSEVEDLSELYIYPSPYRINSFEGNLIFANVPENTQIYIFNINGILVRKLVGTNGLGGMEWDMKDTGGSRVASGVYIYRAIQYDSDNNEKGNKTGKIAVIR